jgi:hypothetical protein
MEKTFAGIFGSPTPTPVTTITWADRPIFQQPKEVDTVAAIAIGCHDYNG